MMDNQVGTVLVAAPEQGKRDWGPWIVVGAIIFVVLLVLVLVLVGVSILVSNLKTSTQPISTTPPPVVNVVPISSKYATDSAVLELKKRTEMIGNEIDSNDLIEPQLSPPSLDLNINIKIN